MKYSFTRGLLLSSAAIFALVPPLWAGIACPVMLVDGTKDADGLSLTFRNKGKLPLQEIALRCAPLGAHAARASLCHAETGLFFPGNTYTIDFTYPVKGVRSVVLSLESARLSDGDVWQAKRDALCKPLRLTK